ncbi:muscle M-line assembly protein unc-89-like isoform X2 [Danaus plexippus]|uniref:muscle M-line assembly protein unc-89-like isoform X2 n=1 Tax=Danaus plexippus TaxID=13037 RepID=UPI0013C50759|nr:muscle M-line assembly protein unc-89-like isoform X2 [Danaus plexippus]XP_032526664.1 muscle M-line assembly protein unc-89-like [Danaus plexippus plexippus]
MAIEKNKCMLTYLEIEEPLEDIVTDEFTHIIFKCKISDSSEECVSYKWYHDGKCLEQSRKHTMSCNEKWHQLEITSIKAYDQGVYSVILKSSSHETYSKANLYVRPIKDRYYNNNNDVVYMNVIPKMIGVVRHLKCSRLLVGSTIELEAEFDEDCLEDYIWYKSNKPFIPHDRTIILNDKRSTTLSILHAKETDSGIYHVVSKSEYGIASTYASVAVINTDFNVLSNSEDVPTVEDLPDEIEVSKGEEVRIVCKATCDINTLVFWSKDGSDLENNDKVTSEYINNSCICLRIKSANSDDSGEYTVTVQDDITGHLESSSFFLNVIRRPNSILRPITLKSSLTPTMACFGSSISFTCSFVIEDPRFHFSVWYIGNYRVERSNHRFHVLVKGGNFIFVVKQVEPGMEGEVICEVRRVLPNGKSFFIDKTTTKLVIVPQAIMEEVIQNVCIKRSIYYYVNSKITIMLVNSFKGIKNGSGIMQENFSDDEITDRSRDTTGSFMITYCSLDDESFYLDVDNNDVEIAAEKLYIYKRCLQSHEASSNISSKSVTVIEWEVAEFQKTNEKWYMIEVGKSNDNFVQAGVSSKPMFELEDPVQEQIMIFRVSAVTSPSMTDESTVRIVPAPKNTLSTSKICELQTMEDFEKAYTKTGSLIGCGAFGSVVLVKGTDGEYYAAKVLKTRTQKKRELGIREYEMMKQLRHPKLIHLFGAYISKDSFVLVMDYLWGNELFDRIVDEEHIKEVDVVPYVRQICEALLYLHELKIAHLDLKPENIICLSPNSLQVKIIDFGLARYLDDSQQTRAIYGTRDYVAPEVLNFDRLTLACDMWSLGVVTYMLLSGVMPFVGENWAQRSANITRAKYNYHESAFKEISDLAKDFVDHLLLLKPEYRMNASQALNHRWVREGPPCGAKAGHMKRTRENLKSYLANYRARWQRAGNVLIAAHRLRTHRSTNEPGAPTVT